VMLVRYQAEDKPATTKPTPTRGVSALLTGAKSALIPEGTDRMRRRREHGHGDDGCCGGPEKTNGRLIPLYVTNGE
jgi:hypothetical protein